MSNVSTTNMIETAMFVHTYRCTHTASPKEIHCFFSTLTDKAHVNQENMAFKVSQNGRLVQVTSEKDSLSSFVELENIRFERIRSSQVAPYAFKVGDHVTVQGELSYSVHKTGSNKKRCPVDARGELKPELSELFLSYLTRVTGIDCARANAAGMLALAWEDRSSPQDKVWLNDVILLNLVGPVVDAQALNRLAVSSVGRRRSYGLGALQVSPVGE